MPAVQGIRCDELLHLAAVQQCELMQAVTLMAYRCLLRRRGGGREGASLLKGNGATNRQTLDAKYT